MLALYVSPEMVRRGNKVTYTQVSHGSSSSRSGSLGDGNLTGMVRTALYVSQEMVSRGNKVTYSQVSHGSSFSRSGSLGDGSLTGMVRTCWLCMSARR